MSSSDDNISGTGDTDNEVVFIIVTCLSAGNVTVNGSTIKINRNE